MRDADVGRRWADKLVKVWLVDGTETWLLIHIEVQSQYQAEFAQRMYVYNYRLRVGFSLYAVRIVYDRPVVSLGVLADDRPCWQPNSYETSVLGCDVRFNFPL